jgi:galacturan 1,4-alpha-galacturonidase
LPQIASDVCQQYPSQVNITNVLFENFSGYTSGKYGRAVARFTCSTNPNAVCDNIKLVNFNVTSPCGDPVVICDGIKGGLGTPCVQYNSTEAKAALAAKCTVPLATSTVLPWN